MAPAGDAVVELPGAGQLAVRARGRICEPCTEIRGLAPASRRIASRCYIHHKPTKNHRPSNAGLFAGQVASTISTHSRVSRGCWEGPKSQPEEQGSNVNSEQHGKRGKRGKMELLDTKNRLEEPSSKIDIEHPGNRGKPGKTKLLDTKPQPFQPFHVGV